MKKIIVKYKHCEKPTVYDVVVFLSYKEGKNEMLLTHAREIVNNLDSRVEWYEEIKEGVIRGEGNGESKPYESKYERENITLPREMAKEIVEVATTLKGCTIDFVNRCNKVLDFDLHKKLNNKYGFTGAKRLYNIFKLN
tara:strand:+ start:43 stop:459 length:417 start_codon:yes stop_codon:yes gene_type:complete